MTPNRYRQCLEELDLSQVGAGRFFEVDERTSRRWVSGEFAIPWSVAMLLELMIAKRLKPNGVRGLAGLKPVEGLGRSVGRPPAASSQ